ncbi:hypothetical protein VTK26DRAFT_43 [Humicola hyalothermophila]
MSSAGDTVQSLNAVTTDALTLITQLEAVVSNVASQKQIGASSEAARAAEELVAANGSLDALSLAHDSAALIKAHATKISLLIINEPFTPTAITKVLRELVAGPVPSLAAATQLCAARRYTQTIQRDLAWRAGRVLKELKDLLSQIPRNGKVLSNSQKNASAGAAEGRGSIITTGVLWSACDDLTTFAKRGFGGNLAHTVDQLRDTLKDVMEELKEWGEEQDEDEDHHDSGGDNDDVAQVTSISGTDDAQAILDDLMNSQQRIPRDDPNKIRERLESCLRRLRMTTLLYQAATKRRLKPLAHAAPVSASDIPARLDEVMALLKRIPERFGSLALAFYELEPSEIDRLMDECFFDAFAVSELLAKPWDGQKDEFTDWAMRFQVEIKKG